MPRSNYKLFETMGKGKNCGTENGMEVDNVDDNSDQNEMIENNEMNEMNDIPRNVPPGRGDSREDDAEEFDVVGGRSEMKRMLRTVPDRVLLFVGSCCVSRMSNREFERILTSQEEDIAEAARELWKYNKNHFSIHRICNSCGQFLNSSEDCSQCVDSSVANFVRIGGFLQIEELVETFIEEILSIRSTLKAGGNIDHNLNSPFFDLGWKSEGDTHLQLSAVISIDGVQISGNSKKLWPISLILVDLPAGIMQRSTSIVLEGLIECIDTPSTAVWNAVMPMLVTDIESHSSSFGGYSFSCSITSCSADQPAKRSFFGIKAHHSSESCFYCLSSGTFYKTNGVSRRESRFGQLTIDDSRNCTNGFGAVPSRAVEFMSPFNTPIDLLHNCGEGLFEIIRKELFAEESSQNRKSELFRCERNALLSSLENVHLHSSLKDISNCRNGSDKTHFFRLMLCMSALECSFINPKARVVIVALGMLTNRMYSDSVGSDLFDIQLCASSAWILSEASERYISIKAHELLYHLPEVNRMFGNTGPLSTHSFESFYHFALGGFSSSITRHFVKNACTKLLLHASIRREIVYRASTCPSKELLKFISLTPDLIPRKVTWKDEISKLSIGDRNFVKEFNGAFFGKLQLGIGTLKSEYHCISTTDDMFFAKTNHGKKCFRFVCALVTSDKVQVLAEPVTTTDSSEQFSSFEAATMTLTDTDLYYGTEVLGFLKCYDGIQCGNLSCQRTIIEIDSIVGIASYIHSSNHTVFVQSNGALIHN